MVDSLQFTEWSEILRASFAAFLLQTVNSALCTVGGGRWVVNVKFE